MTARAERRRFTGVYHRHRENPAGKDPFLENFFRDMSPALSLTDEQLLEIKKNFAGRSRGAHSVDLRFSIPFLRTYIVFLFGRERRSRKCRAHDRKLHPVATMGNLFVIAVIATVLSLSVFITGDGVKSWLGIDVASTGGVHATIEGLHQNRVSAVKGM